MLEVVCDLIAKVYMTYTVGYHKYLNPFIEKVEKGGFVTV